MAPQFIYNKQQIFIPKFIEQTVSIDFDGSTEHATNTTGVNHGFGDIFSISAWVKPEDITPTGPFGAYIISMSAGVLNSIDGIALRMGQSNTGLEVHLFNTASSFRKRYLWNSQFSVGVWTHVLVTWDGTSLKAFFDSVETAPSSTPNDLSHTVLSVDRVTAIGRINSPNASYWDGLIHSIAIWDVDVGAAASTIYNTGDGSGFNLGANAGSYTFSGDLQHWWRLGFDSSDIGKDSGIGSPLIDVNANGNLDSGDIVSDVP